MVDQVVINFPEMPDELEQFLLENKDEIVVDLWDSEKRERYQTKWEGSKICCPVKMWFDFPDGISIDSDIKRTDET